MKASAIANSDFVLLAALKNPRKPSCLSSGEHGASLHKRLLCKTHLAHLFSPLYGIKVAKTSFPLLKSFCLFVIFIACQFCGKSAKFARKNKRYGCKKNVCRF